MANRDWEVILPSRGWSQSKKQALGVCIHIQRSAVGGVEDRVSRASRSAAHFATH